MKTVLFACVHNAGRSQMAASLFNRIADPAKARAISAGTQPAERVHPEVATVLGEMGIRLDGVKPRRLTDEIQATTDYLVTMGCGEACPLVPGAKRTDWHIEDPKDKPASRVREIRDELAARIEALVAEHGWGR